MDKSFQGIVEEISIRGLELTFDRYGHGVLRNPDPRFIALQAFCNAHPELKDSPIIRLVTMVRCVISTYLIETKLHNRPPKLLLVF